MHVKAIDQMVAARLAIDDRQGELSSCIDFSSAEAVRQGDGVFSKSSGIPALPGWLGKLPRGFVVTPRVESGE